MHGIWARRQLEHGMCLSHRTFLLRQVTQLRGLRRSEGMSVGVYTDAPGKAGCVWGRGDDRLLLSIPFCMGESVDADGKPSAKDSTGLVGFDGLDTEAGGGNGWPVPSMMGVYAFVLNVRRRTGWWRGSGGRMGRPIGARAYLDAAGCSLVRVEVCDVQESTSLIENVPTQSLCIANSRGPRFFSENSSGLDKV